MAYTTEPLIKLISETIFPANPNGLIRNTYTEKTSRTGLILNAAERKGWEIIPLRKSMWLFKDGDKITGGTYEHTISSQVQFARTIATHKDLTKKVLEIGGVRTPQGHAFESGDYETGLKFYRENQGNVIVKPATGSVGQAVTLDIPHEEDFATAWDRVKEEFPSDRILVEEYIEGFDIRVVIINGAARAAVSRVNAFVIGDGQSTIDTLVTQRENERAKCTYLRSQKTIVDWEWLHTLGINEDSIPSPREVVILNRVMSGSTGRELINVFDRMSPQLIQLAEDTANSIPFQPVVGVDLFVESLQATDGVVLELNVQPHFEIHHYPTYGNPVDIAEIELDTL